MNDPRECPKCKKQVVLKHLHDCAHGIPETHMSGSERYECPECGHMIFKEEGEKLDLKFVLD
jgi:DNA-directed RNA polymerase subunit RPC12/RpoP